MPVSEPTSKKHPVPQNVMEVEFKLIGNLTLRQFLYLLGGAAATFLSYKSISLFPFKFLVPFTIVILTIAAAFASLEERGLDQWVSSFLLAIWSPTQRVWRKEPQPPIYLLSDYAEILTSEIVSLAPVKSRSRLTDYLQRVEEAQEEKDELLEKKEEAFFKKLGLEEIYESPTTSQRATAIEPKLGPLPKAATASAQTEPKEGNKPILRPAPKPHSKLQSKSTISPKKADVPLASPTNSSVSPAPRPARPTIKARIEPPPFTPKLQPKTKPIVISKILPEHKEKEGYKTKPLPTTIAKPSPLLPLVIKKSGLDTTSLANTPSAKPIPPKPKTEEKTVLLPKIKKELIGKIAKPNLATERTIAESKIIKIQGPTSKPQFVPAIKNVSPGRKIDESVFKNIPGMEGELILPIKGETVIAPTGRSASSSSLKDDKTTALLQDLRKTIEDARASLEKLKSTSPKTGKQIEPSSPFTSPEFKRKSIKSQLHKFTQQLETLREKQKTGEKSLEKTIAYYEQRIKDLTHKLQEPEEKEATVTIPPIGETEKRVEELRKQSQILQHQLETVQETLQALKKEQDKAALGSERKVFIQQQQQILDNLVSSKKEYERRIEELINQVKQRAKLKTKRQQAQEATIKKDSTGPFTASKPNIIYGTVRSKDGHLLEKAVIIIKDINNEPVRALKTNALGQFKINTPLPNNTYRVEVSKPGRSFPPAEIKLQGAVLGEIQIIES